MFKECHHPFMASIAGEARHIGASAHFAGPPGFWPAQPSAWCLLLPGLNPKEKP
jgi:hypothetical protein